MANYNVYVQHTGGPKTTPVIEVEYPENTVSGTGHSSGSPLELEIGDTLTFQNADTNIGPGNLVISSFSIFTNNDDITISASDTGTFVKTVASGTTTADTLNFDKTNDTGTATTNYFYVERQAAAGTVATPTNFTVTDATGQNGTYPTGSSTTMNLSADALSGHTLQFKQGSGSFSTTASYAHTYGTEITYEARYVRNSDSATSATTASITRRVADVSITVTPVTSITSNNSTNPLKIADIDSASALTQYRVRATGNINGSSVTNLLIDAPTAANSSPDLNASNPSELPESDSSATYTISVRVKQDSNGDELYRFLPTSVTNRSWTLSRGSPTPTAPTISSVDVTGGATSNMTATVNLSDTGTNGTLEYAQTTTNSLPSTGWQTSNQFTHPRPPAAGPAPSTRYYWASRNRNTSAYSAGFQRDVGYFTGDPSVDAPTLNPTSPLAAAYSGTVAATITGGSAGTRYRIKNTTTGLGTGNTGDGNGTIYIGSVRSSDLPDPGEADNYEVQYKVLESKGGNDLWASVSPARTFSIARTASTCPTSNTTHTITGVTSGSSQTLSQTSKVTSGNNLTISLTTPYSATTGFPTGPGQNKSSVSASISSGGGSRSVSHSGTNATITYTPAYTTTQTTAVLTITHIEWESFADDPQAGTFVWNIAYTDTITLTVTICPQTQTLVDITSVDSITPNENTSDQVTATVTTPSGVSVSSYAWSTTGNITLSSSTVQSPTLSFGNVTADSSASVTVTVTDSNNNTATDTQNYTIQFVNQAPVAIIQGPSSGDVDSSVTFSGSDSYDPDGGSVQYQWSATNGGETFTQAKSTNSSFSFTPTETGSYNVTLTAHDSNNATNSTIKSYLSTTTEAENTSSAGGFGFEIYAANGDTILRADELLIRKVAAVDLDSNGDASTTIQNTESQTTVVGFQSTNDQGSLSLSTSGTTTKNVSISGGAANTRVSLFLLK